MKPISLAQCAIHGKKANDARNNVMLKILNLNNISQAQISNDAVGQLRYLYLVPRHMSRIPIFFRAELITVQLCALHSIWHYEDNE